MKALRTIRFDESDEHVFERPANPGEWGISGAFAFADEEPHGLTGKARQAFANGFLGLSSRGRSTFVVVIAATEDELARACMELTQHLIEDYGAPDVSSAHVAAREELEFVQDLCRDVPVGTIFTVRRGWNEQGSITEEFRIIEPSTREPMHARIWAITNDGT